MIQLAIMDSTGLVVNGDVRADYFIGDGSQLTNIPMPSAMGLNGSVQFNNNGTFAGSNVFYFNTNGGLSIGYNSSNIGKGLTVYNDLKVIENNTLYFGDMSKHKVKILGRLQHNWLRK